MLASNKLLRVPSNNARLTTYEPPNPLDANVPSTVTVFWVPSTIATSRVEPINHPMASARVSLTRIPFAESFD